MEPEFASAFAAQLFSRGRDSDESLEVCFRNFLAETAELLIVDDVAIFEICNVPTSEATEDDGEPTDEGLLTLASVLADSVEFQADQVIQNVSKNEFREAQIITLPRNRVFLVETPNWIEGGLGFPLTVKNLIHETKRDSTPINHFQANAHGKPSYFDFSEFRRMRETRILSLTKSSGWQGRTLYDARVTEYYFATRYLRFVYNNLLLRDYLIKKINLDLFPQLRQLGAKIEKLTITGLPTPEQILEVQTKLENGEIGFKEALKQTKSL